MVIVNTKNLVRVFHVTSFLWLDTDSDTVIWHKKFPLNWDFTKKSSMKHYNFWKRGTIGFGGKIQVMTKQIRKLHIFSKNMWKSTWLFILNNLNSARFHINNSQISTLGSEEYMKFKKKIGTRVLTMNDNLCMNKFSGSMFLVSDM